LKGSEERGKRARKYAITFDSLRKIGKIYFRPNRKQPDKKLNAKLLFLHKRRQSHF